MKTFFLRLQNIYLMTALLGLTATILYLTQYGESGQISITPTTIEPLRNADSFLLKPSGTKYSPDGSVAYEWRADTAERMRSGEVILIDPFYIGLMRTDREWTAQAQRGRLAADGQSLLLNNDVVVKELVHDARVDTEQLLIDMERNTVTTERPVKLATPNGTTTAVGLNADLARPYVELLSEVKGYYETAL